jgi:hypothetical protein
MSLMKKTHPPRYLTEGAIKELVDATLRTAFREQARDLEKHLADINRRLTELETKR